MPLKAGGAECPVTSQNKAEYVSLYVDYVLSKSCEAQFVAYKKGFLKVVSGRLLQLFHPQELMALVVGNENYDWDVLERLCQYKEGYTADHQTIINFWQVFHELSEENKRKFLLFLTGSDRIPIAGMSSVTICILNLLISSSLDWKVSSTAASSLEGDGLLTVANRLLPIMDILRSETVRI